ncbi:MAG: hypothetical protein M3P82_07055, partial [Bacteroidota bacterium]|nr:hypothetical protein [Bacteroidota bacterium]
ISSPYAILDSSAALIDSLSFSGQFTFTNATTGTYFITVKHFNSIETWSKPGGELITSGGSVYNYDFTVSSAQAYGNNLKQVGNKFCIYSGDVDQGGSINLVDLVEIYNQSSLFSSGPDLPQDLNGDNTVNISDILICYNNPFVRVVTPIAP